ncbi:hypothetical protein LF048_000399 [Vibrio cholerae]|nr:hypothetical protein [Vibrio cholerae]EJL6695711.1 hypothetical protein [Vibrio cholerae]
MYNKTIKMSQLRMKLSDVGLLGEVYIPPHHLPPCDLACIEDLHLPTQNKNYLSRGKKYYEESTCFQLILDIFDYHNRLRTTTNPYVSYILMDHILNGLLRLLDSLISHDQSEFVNYYIQKSKEMAQGIVDFFMGKTHFTVSSYIISFPHHIAKLKPRVYLEGDNHLLTLISVMQMPRSDVCVGILLGGAASAAIYSAYHESQLNYLKISRYDDTKKCNEFLWGNPIDLRPSVLILDDNCGTGKTLHLAKSILKNHYQIDAKIAAIELHWEKLLRVKGYYHQDSVFDLSSLDYLTPWNVRHHHLLKQLVQQPSTTQNHTTNIMEWLVYSKSVLNLLSNLGTQTQAFDSLRNYCLKLECYSA